MTKWIIAVLVYIFSAPLLAETSLWKISKEGKHLYLGGTVHLLSAKDLPFPQAFDRVYAEAQLLAFETDIARLEDPAIQFQLMSSLAYQDGRMLNQVISAGLYEELNQYLLSRGLMPNMFLTMKPSGVMLMMLSIEFKRLGINQDGADSHYFKRALADNKPVLGLEKIEQHLAYLADMGMGNEERFLRQTLDDIHKTETMMDEIVAGWKNGDAALLEKLTVSDMREYYPKLYDTLLVQRNYNWLPQVRKMAKTPEVELILVGAAHLIGPDGLLALLQAEGYTIEQI